MVCHETPASFRLCASILCLCSISLLEFVACATLFSLKQIENNRTRTKNTHEEHDTSDRVYVRDFKAKDWLFQTSVGAPRHSLVSCTTKWRIEGRRRLRWVQERALFYPETHQIFQEFKTRWVHTGSSEPAMLLSIAGKESTRFC